MKTDLYCANPAYACSKREKMQQLHEMYQDSMHKECKIFKKDIFNLNKIKKKSL